MRKRLLPGRRQQNAATKGGFTNGKWNVSARTALHCVQESHTAFRRPSSFFSFWKCWGKVVSLCLSLSLFIVRQIHPQLEYWVQTFVPCMANTVRVQDSVHDAESILYLTFFAKKDKRWEREARTNHQQWLNQQDFCHFFLPDFVPFHCLPWT